METAVDINSNDPKYTGGMHTDSTVKRSKEDSELRGYWLFEPAQKASILSILNHLWIALQRYLYAFRQYSLDHLSFCQLPLPFPPVSAPDMCKIFDAQNSREVKWDEFRAGQITAHGSYQKKAHRLFLENSKSIIVIFVDGYCIYQMKCSRLERVEDGHLLLPGLAKDMHAICRWSPC
jgi:hypothetical protein